MRVWQAVVLVCTFVGCICTAAIIIIFSRVDQDQWAKAPRLMVNDVTVSDGVLIVGFVECDSLLIQTQPSWFDVGTTITHVQYVAGLSGTVVRYEILTPAGAQEVVDKRRAILASYSALRQSLSHTPNFATTKALRQQLDPSAKEPGLKVTQ